MLLVGHYSLVLHHGADPADLDRLLTDVRWQLTRITTSVGPTLLRPWPPATSAVSARRYVVELSVTTMTDRGYDFTDNLEPLQRAVADVATVLGVASFEVPQAALPSD